MRLRARAWGGAGLLGLWLGTLGAGAAEEIRNWPCEAPLAESFQPEDVWGGPLPEPLGAGWQADAAVRAVVAFAADPENPPGQGARKIDAFAEDLGESREARLLLVFAGLLDEFDTQRGFVIEGVRDFVVRAKILNEAIERHDAALTALPADGGSAVDDQRDGYREARFWDERNLDDALDEAKFLCRRYAYLDEKLRRLTEAVRSSL